MNGEPAGLAYVRAPDGRYHAVCLTVLSLAADGRIVELTTFVSSSRARSPTCATPGTGSAARSPPGCFKTFAKDTPWVHVDIAGPASLSTTRPSLPELFEAWGFPAVLDV